MSDGSHHALEQIPAMPDDINAQIAELRGWKPCKGMLGLWLPPDGSGVGQPVPRFTSDWNATGELLKACDEVDIRALGNDTYYVAVKLYDGKSPGGETPDEGLMGLAHAIAAAFLAAHEEVTGD